MILNKVPTEAQQIPGMDQVVNVMLLLLMKMKSTKTKNLGVVPDTLTSLTLVTISLYVAKNYDCVGM